MDVITLASLKGGSGKTTTAIALGRELARAGQTVELYDLDGQASATLALGHAPGAFPLSDRHEVAPGFWLRSGGRGAMSDVGAVAARMVPESDADVIVLDTPPGLHAPTIQAIRLATVVIVPLEPSPLSVPGFLDVLQVVEELDESAGRAWSTTPGRVCSPATRGLFVRVNARRKIVRELMESLRADHVFYKPFVPEDVKAAEAPDYGEAVTDYAKRSRAAKAYRELAKAVRRDLKRIGKAAAV